MVLKDAGIYDLVNVFKGEGTPAHSASQGGIINNTPRVINIPAYQRPYRWGPDNILRLFQDYEENRSEYFLGSAVVVEKSKQNGTIEFDVVDGQQRITTLFLLNYIRYLLKREYVLEKLKKPYQPKSSELCNDLMSCYVNLIGKNAIPFANIIKKIDELTDDETLNPNERVDALTSCYKTELCIADNKSTPQETIEERLKQTRLFFDQEQLCLKYSRARYDTVLRNALCRVFLKHIEDTNNFELSTAFDFGKDDFSLNYVQAMKTIFNRIWDYACRSVNTATASLLDKTERAIVYADEIIKNMSLCIVLTENESDANKLFEVLNDRSLEVEDLELIKNHFYKEYCTKSNDTDEEKDARITQLDELWADKVFSGNGDMKNRLISYLSAVYLTSDKELGYKDDAKLKDAIERGYSSRFYPVGGKEYKYENILADFNTYYAVKIILDKFGVRAQKLPEVCLNAEQDRKSITYKTIHLLNALKYHAVIPAITNVIIATYARAHSLTDVNFESSFTQYIDAIINDHNNNNADFSKIHKCAYMLWVASVKAKDYVMPRSIARRIIEKYGHFPYSDESMDFLGEEIHSLDGEFDEWMNNWTYASNKSFVVKVLLLNLLLSSREPTSGGYKESTVKINLRSLTYQLDPGKLQLDHLEASNLNHSIPERYYLPNDIEKRMNDVNGYLGNFMILDAADNNQKNNVPLCDALGFYSKIETSWLIQDIKEMMADGDYFDLEKKVPKEEFFIERTKLLKKYFKALVNRRMDQTQITVALN